MMDAALLLQGLATRHSRATHQSSSLPEKNDSASVSEWLKTNKLPLVLGGAFVENKPLKSGTSHKRETEQALQRTELKCWMWSKTYDQKKMVALLFMTF